MFVPFSFFLLKDTELFPPFIFFTKSVFVEDVAFNHQMFNLNNNFLYLSVCIDHVLVFIIKYSVNCLRFSFEGHNHYYP